MNARTSSQYRLVPSSQVRDEGQAPTALLPAIPTQLEAPLAPAIYALVNTAEKLSTVHAPLLQSFGAPVVGRVRLVGQAESVPVVKLSVKLLDHEFQPWLRLRDVPFAVLPGRSDGGVDITLGFEGCLSKLYLAIDYPGGSLSVSAPDELLTLDKHQQESVLPSRLQEAKELVRYGSYNAAVAMAAAALAELASQVWPKQPHDTSHSWFAAALPAEYQDSFTRLWDLRNRAIHGKPGSRIRAVDAEMAVKDAETIAYWMAGSREPHS